MILKRKIYSKLLNWKNECKGTKAIMVEGVRRIGKSTIVEEFARQEYRSYIIIDFAKKDKIVEEYFNQYLNNLDDFFMLLAKFIQGLPVVGIIGGLMNPVYYRKILSYVRLKYRKRYLLTKSTVSPQ